MSDDLNELFVFSSVGSELNQQDKCRIFDSWEIKTINSGCTIYDHSDSFNYEPYFNIIEFNVGYKFPNFIWLNQKYNILSKYKYIALVDDDLKFNQNSIFHEILLMMKNYQLSVCSISNDCKDKHSVYLIMHTNMEKELWLTNFCEMGLIVIESDLLKFLINYYHKNNLNIIDMGWDFLISHIVEKFNLNMGIIKYLTYNNPNKPYRNYGRSEWEQDEAVLPFIDPIILKKKIKLC